MQVGPLCILLEFNQAIIKINITLISYGNMLHLHNIDVYVLENQTPLLLSFH